MNTASTLFFICYIPEFYANYVNKNANLYNVFEKIILFTATTFALSYSIKTNNKALIINYSPLFALDFIALNIRCYYAYKNINRDVRVKNDLGYDIENPMHDIQSVDSD